MNLGGPVEDEVGAALGLVPVVPRPALTAGAGVLNSVPTSCLPLALSWPRVVLVPTAPVPPVPAVPWQQYKLSI